MEGRRTAQRAAAMLSLVGLAEFGERYPHELSGGMRQRVSIARALAPDPRILLMDEPFGALDEQTRIKMGHELLRIWSQTGKTIFFITHSLTEALFLSDVVLVMSHRPGRIVGVIDCRAAASAHLRHHRQRGIRRRAQSNMAAHQPR